MKIRNGFVSNSSAASFIIDWSCFEKDKEKAIKYVMGDFCNKEIFDEIMQCTWALKDKYITTFGTTCLNDPSDIDEICAAPFFFSLFCKNQYVDGNVKINKAELCSEQTGYDYEEDEEEI